MGLFGAVIKRIGIDGRPKNYAYIVQLVRPAVSVTVPLKLVINILKRINCIWKL